MKINQTVKQTETPFEMPRQKSRSLFISLGYRLTRLGSRILGARRLLRFHLNAEWLSWRLAYELSSEIYGEEFYSRGRALREEDLRRLIPKNGSFIDIGCGFGEWCRIASKYANRVVGVDYEKSKIEKAEKLTESDNVTFLIGDVTKDFADEQFDVALLSHVLEHIDNADIFLQQLRPVAKTLIIEVPDFENNPLNWVRLKEGCRFYTDNDHVREYTLDALSDQLKQNGWRVKKSFRRNGSMISVAENSLVP